MRDHLRVNRYTEALTGDRRRFCLYGIYAQPVDSISVCIVSLPFFFRNEYRPILMTGRNSLRAARNAVQIVSWRS